MKLYNSFSKRREVLKTLNEKRIKIYVCGITPYDTTHLGHAFTYISFDVLIRFLKYKGYFVDYTQNVTDIDDDVLRKAKEEKRDWIELGKFWTNNFLADLRFLNILPPTHYVKATDSIEKIIEIAKALILKGFAYEKNGNVYFEVSKFKDYGKLSKYTRSQMIPILKERGGDPKDPLKKDPLDFILWQKRKEREPFWKSPWGDGRPGWHIECSAMINTYLGDQIDIHGGGRDLIYPHHESEIAESESFTGEKPFVRYWMHVSMVLFEGEKMSKSLGNLVMIPDLSKKYSANIIRFLLLSHQYNKPWEFDYSEIDNVKKKYTSIQKALDKKLSDDFSSKGGSASGRKSVDYIKEFEKFMEDDLDIPQAFNLILEISKSINSGKDKSLNSQKALKKILDILGFQTKF